MLLSDLNNQILLEWWAEDVVKNMEKNNTKGAFTKQCQDMGFKKASYACIQHVNEEYEKIKNAYNAGKIQRSEYDDWALLKKRATLAKTFKKWGAKKKKGNLG